MRHLVHIFSSERIGKNSDNYNRITENLPWIVSSLMGIVGGGCEMEQWCMARRTGERVRTHNGIHGGAWCTRSYMHTVARWELACVMRSGRVVPATT